MLKDAYDQFCGERKHSANVTDRSGNQLGSVGAHSCSSVGVTLALKKKKVCGCACYGIHPGGILHMVGKAAGKLLSLVTVWLGNCSAS